MNIWLVMPILVPFTIAIVCLLTAQQRMLHRWLAVVGSASLLFMSIVLFVQVWKHQILASYIGNFPAPFGIVIVADTFSALMVLITAVIGFAVTLYSLASIDEGRESFGYYPLFNVLLMGVNGAFLTGDIFNLYVWFEVMLIASFVLLALGGEQRQMEAAVKYVTLNLMSSAFFLAAVGILYGTVGTLNMADLAVQLAQADPGFVTTISILFLIAFGIKAALFPLYFWLPASYHVPAVAVSAVFAGLLTKVGVYALVRVFTLLFLSDVPYTHGILLVLSALTMVSGILGAVAQNEFRRILSFHIISQIGYMTLGLALFTPAAVAGSVFYIAHHIIVKTNLFLVSGVAQQVNGTFELKKMGGLYRSAPVLSILFLIPALSLAGMPPLSGFFAKLTLAQAGFAAGHWWVVLIALAVGVLTLYSMAKIWAEAFWKTPPPPEPGEVRVVPGERSRFELQQLYSPILILAMVTLLIGFGAGPMYAVAERAATQLMNPKQYVQTVLGAKNH